MATSKWIQNGTAATFETMVLAGSSERAVVVDFWAPWCGPCRALAPALEALAEEGAGKFLLVKVNVDDEPELAGHFGVNGIPAVFAIRNGSVVDQFTGLLPEDELKAFVARLTPSDADNLVERAYEREAKEPKEAEDDYRQALIAEPGHEAARVGLARLLLRQHGKEAEVTELVRGIDVGPQAQEVERLRRIMTLQELPHSESELSRAREAVAADPESAEKHYDLGAILAAKGDYNESLAVLLAAAERDKKLAQTSVRELMVNIFHIIGVRSEYAELYRDKLRSLLY